MDDRNEKPSWKPHVLAGACLLLAIQVSGAAGSGEQFTGLPSLQMPVLCEDGVHCVIQNYFDHTSGKGFSDYRCGNLGYDEHDGTDIRLSNLEVMRRGVPVVAAADGVVRATRDSMPDVSIRDVGPGAVRGREAGNAVVVRHGNDWETQYSHLRLGSVRVKPGDRVEAGDVLGLVGLSGRTEFPHLHFEVRYQGRPVDPFVGLGERIACEAGRHPLWSASAMERLVYRPTVLLQSGFWTEVPNRRMVEEGKSVPLPSDSHASALVFWVELLGVQDGDMESITITGPDGRQIASKIGTVPGNKALWFSYAGRKRRGEKWPEGLYHAQYRLSRTRNANSENVITVDESAWIGLQRR